MSLCEDQIFTAIQLSDLRSYETFENCRFISCNWSRLYANGFTFIDCEFQNCDLEQADLGNTSLQSVIFKNCKLTGVDLSKCTDFLFAVSLEDCKADNIILHPKKNKKATFTNCSLREADFSNADLTDTVLNNCDLHRATFSQTILKNADLRTSYNFSIDPDDNMVKNARFSIHGLPGLLEKSGLRIGN